LTRIEHIPLILVQDIPLRLQYNTKMKLNMNSVWHNYLFILMYHISCLTATYLYRYKFVNLILDI
jgi:hypothetical protein